MVLGMPESAEASLVGVLSEAGIHGGATYDAIVGLTAAAHDEVLLTRDRRAGATYEALGVGYRVLG